MTIFQPLVISKNPCLGAAFACEPFELADMVHCKGAKREQSHAQDAKHLSMASTHPLQGF